MPFTDGSVLGFATDATWQKRRERWREGLEGVSKDRDWREKEYGRRWQRRDLVRDGKAEQEADDVAAIALLRRSLFPRLLSTVVDYRATCNFYG
jgi:hypothetical protein